MPVRKLLEKFINISSSEVPRTAYAWWLRFLFKTGHVIGWTTIIAITVVHYSITALPVIILAQAVFIMVGMMLFSVLIDKLSAKKIIMISTLAAMTFIFLAAFFYQTTYLSLIFGLIASGLFISQSSMILSSYTEDHFSPLEAERTFPVIESSETLGGVIGGLILAFFSSYASSILLALWILFLGLFLMMLLLWSPKLPFFMKKAEKSSKNKYKGVNHWNTITKAFTEIRRVPFLQILIAILVIHWITSQFVEFLYTNAIDQSVSHEGTMEDHESSLTHGLGSLHTMFHSFAFLTELALAGRFIKKMGVYAGFMLHGIMTLIGSVMLMFGYSYFTAVLVKNNFKISSIVQKSCYENTYYAFKYGTQKDLREFFEGVIYPISAIVGTILIIIVQAIFVGSMFEFLLPVLLMAMVVTMIMFTLPLQKKYTEVAISNLNSDYPLAKIHAIEILAQKGHKQSYDLFHKMYRLGDINLSLKRKIVYSLAHLGNVRAVNLMMNIIQSYDNRLSDGALYTLKKLCPILKKDTKRQDLYQSVIAQLLKYIRTCDDERLRAQAVGVLGEYDHEAIVPFLMSDSGALQAEAAVCLWHKNKYRDNIRRMIREFINTANNDNYWNLIHLVGRINIKEIHDLLSDLSMSKDDELRMLAYYGLVRIGYTGCITRLINLLLFGNDLIFQKGTELMKTLEATEKRKVAKKLIPTQLLDAMPSTIEGKRVLERLKALYEACDAYDERNHIEHVLLPQINTV
ncbi:MFS transporter [Candidatus Peregrinibacteria bacterium]|nr:MFS transporter [Candidatus Peregrinibacteria bacterium]